MNIIYIIIKENSPSKLKSRNIMCLDTVYIIHTFCDTNDDSKSKDGMNNAGM